MAHGAIQIHDDTSALSRLYDIDAPQVAITHLL
jgi:hypothetical protein